MQTLLLVCWGGVIGVALGVGVQLAFPYLLAKLINVQTDVHLQIRTVLTGLGAGVLTTLLFTLPPLLDIRGVRPILILRRAVEDNDDPFTTAIRKKITKNLAQIGAAVLILIGLALIAMTLSDSTTVGTVFSVGLVVVLAVLLAASSGLLAALRFFLSRTRLPSPFFAAPWACKPVQAGQSERCIACSSRHGRDADHDRVPGAASGRD